MTHAVLMLLAGFTIAFPGTVGEGVSPADRNERQIHGEAMAVENHVETRGGSVVLYDAANRGALSDVSLTAHPRGSAQVGTVTGQVTEARTRRPLANVQVSIPGRGLGGITGVDGRFRIENVAAGTIEVRAELIGFAVGNSSITLAAGQTAVVCP
jgi:hypothetical protein